MYIVVFYVCNDNIKTTYEIYILIGDFLGIFTIYKSFRYDKKRVLGKKE